MKKNSLSGPKRTARTVSASRPSQLPTDFIALGSKPKERSHDNGVQHRMPPIKKTKIHSSLPILTTPLSRLAAAAESLPSRMSPTIPESSAPCIDCPPEDLVHRVMKHIDIHTEQVEGLLCGAIRNLRLNRVKPETTTVLSLLHLAKIRPDVFNNEYVIESLCSLLKKDVGIEYIKSKTNNIVAVIACSILMNVLEEDDSWPIIIVRVFLDDSFAERIWVDHADCQPFVKNILTAFGTKVSQKIEKDDELMITDDSSKETIISRFDSDIDTVQSLAIDLIKERLSRRQTDIVVNAVGGVAGQAGAGTALTGKFLIRTLASASGMQETRTLAIQKLEMWLQNPKLVKPAQDLLHAICVNCNTHSQEDVNVIGHMTKMRLKSKLHLNQYLICIKELIDAHPDNLKTMFSYVLYNELSNARNQSNMAVVTYTLQNYPEAAAKTLASICQDLLLQQEDYLRAVRALLREIVRSMKHDMNFTALALGLMQEPDMEKYKKIDQTHRDRFFASTSDLICLTILLTVTPQTKEAINVLNGKKKETDSFVTNAEAIYTKFKLIIAEIQHDALCWAHSIVMPPLSMRMTPSEYIQLIHKVLFMKPSDSYHTRDNWPPESERAFVIKSCHDSPILEGALLWIAAIGLSQEHPLALADALELIGQLVRRAGALARPDLNPITAERSDLIDTILALCQYHHPGNIRLPTEYIPPSLAISQLYWAALQSLLVIISFNPSTIGHQAWTQYPMLKVLMEMAIVNRFSYPPVTLVDDDIRNQMVGKEHQMAMVEKSEILEFESHLAAATTRLVVTEETSLLLSQLIAMDPQGHPRRPPDRVLEQIGAMSSRLQLGVWLCRSRQPDFLLEIINRHGENQSMTWLPDLVSSSKGDVGLLPVQCLCEFLLVHDSESEKLSNGGIHTNELVSQIQKLLVGESLDDSLQVTQYFLKRLYSPQKIMRERARKALSLILFNLSDNAMDCDDAKDINGFRWLLDDLIQLPHYVSVIRTHAVEAIQSAALIEAEPLCVVAYVRFLSNDLRQFQSLDSVDELFTVSTNYARMASHLLIDRKIIVDSAISLVDHKLVNGDDLFAGESFILSLLEIYIFHIHHAQEHDLRRRMASEDANNDGMPWSDSQDEIYVKWPNNYGAATLHILIPQASIILLGFGPPSRLWERKANSSVSVLENDNLYNKLMGLWFSEEGYIIPQAFLMDTQEEALLVPDWLRLRMLRSQVMPTTRRLAFAAVRDLEVEQLILFVQSFGIPVESMNLLLEILDSQCDSNGDVLLNATSGNASYMSRLLDVQRMRGCKAGSKFAALLKSKSDDPMQAAPTCVIDLVDDSSDSAVEVDVVPPSGPKVPQDLPHMRQCLIRLFSASAGGNAEGWSSLLQAVNQSQGSSNQTALLCLASLHNLIFTDISIEFVTFLYNCPTRACCLLRALDRYVCSPRRKISSRVLNKFKEVVDKIQGRGKDVMTKLGSKSRSLYYLASSWQARNASSSKGIRPRRISSTSEQGDNLRQSDWSRLEEFLRHQLAFLEKDEEIKAKVGLVAQIFLEEIGHRRTLMSQGKLNYNDVCFTSIGTTGLLVDWLQLLDPELLAHTPSLQRKLLFEIGKNDVKNISDDTAPVFDQAYLLSLLAEHCNWETIHSSLQWLLSDSTQDPTDENSITNSSISVDPKTALDFVWVVIQAPKIWQGRENKSTSINEPVLELSTSQFSRLLCYIVAASASLKALSSDENQGISYVNLFSNYFSKFGQARFGKKRVCDIAMFIRNKMKTTPPQSPCSPIWWQLMAQMYVLQPNIPVWDEMQRLPETSIGLTSADLDRLSDTITSVNIGPDCQTDALVCSMLNRLGYVKSKSTLVSTVGSSVMLSNLDSAYDANLILTKIASSRPFLVLRQLRTLAAMLRGRTRHDFTQFKVQHHLPLMLNTICILQQLTPRVFRALHSQHLYDLMEIFWQMLRNYCHRARRQMLPVLAKTLLLTHDYLSHVPNNATKLLSKHHATLQMLVRTYSDQESIVPLVMGLQSAISSWSNTPDTAGVITTSVRTPMAPQSSSLTPNSDQGIPIYMELISENQDLENILQVLGDFDHASKRRIDNIAPYVFDLRRIFSTNSDTSARKSALSAVLRYARENPACAEVDLFPEYIACLREINGVTGRDGDDSALNVGHILPQSTTNSSSDSTSRSLIHDTASVARDLLQSLPDMTVLCRQNATQLLGAAFDTGAKCGSAFSYPKSATGESASSRTDNYDVTDLLAKSLWLLCGMAETDMKPATPS